MLIYAVTETNINGCGDGATEYVKFHKDEPLTDEEEAIFQTALDRARIKGDEEDWDTSDRVDEAAQEFTAQTGILCETILSPCAGSFEF